MAGMHVKPADINVRLPFQGEHALGRRKAFCPFGRSADDIVSSRGMRSGARASACGGGWEELADGELWDACYI